jgi:UDP-glucose 4-epimerase
LKILITGGLGFIGSELYKNLKKKHDIILLDKVKKKKRNYICCNLLNKNKLNKIKIKDVDLAIHLASQSSVAKSYLDIENDLKSNILVNYNFLKWCADNKVKRFFYSSTYNVYTENFRKIYYTETDNCEPCSFYGISKLASEMYIKTFCRENQIKWNILRLFNVYGSNQNYTNYHGLVNIFLYMAKRNGKIDVKGALDRIRDFIHIDDVINAINLLIKSKKNHNHVFNIGTGKPTSLKKLVQIISFVLKKKILINKKKGTKGDFKVCAANIKKISKKTKFKIKWNLLDGITNVNNLLNKKNENFRF